MMLTDKVSCLRGGGCSGSYLDYRTLTLPDARHYFFHEMGSVNFLVIFLSACEQTSGYQYTIGHKREGRQRGTKW